MEAFAVNTIISISSRWLLSSMNLNSILRTKVEKSYEITKQKPEGDFKAPTRFLIIWTLSCLYPQRTSIMEIKRKDWIRKWHFKPNFDIMK